MPSTLYIVLLVTLGTGSVVQAETINFREHGGSCRRDLSSPSTTIAWSANGKSNLDIFNDALVNCPISWRDALPSTPQNTIVYYNDGNYYEILHCTAVAIHSDGPFWLGPTRFSCPTQGGCSSSAPNQYTGVNSLSVGSIGLPASVVSYVIHCSLPDYEQSASGIVGYVTPITI